MRCSPFDARKSPLAPLFQRGVLLWDREELRVTNQSVSSNYMVPFVRLLHGTLES